MAGKRRLVRLRRTDGDRHYPRDCPPHVALTDDAWDCEKAKAAVQQKIGTDSEQLLLAHCLVAASFARGCTTARSARHGLWSEPWIMRYLDRDRRTKYSSSQVSGVGYGILIGHHVLYSISMHCSGPELRVPSVPAIITEIVVVVVARPNYTNAVA